MSENLTISIFSSHLNEIFQLDLGSSALLELELVEVTSLSSGAQGWRAMQGIRREPFSLVFRGPADPLLKQRIYTLKHETMGTFEIFLVPIGGDAEGCDYQAVFN